MTSKTKGWSNRQKDKGWGYAFAHWLPFVWIYYAITRRTITPFFYQVGGGFVVGFSVGLVALVVNPKVDNVILGNLVRMAGGIASPFLVKKGIDQSRKFGKEKLKI